MAGMTCPPCSAFRIKHMWVNEKWNCRATHYMLIKSQAGRHACGHPAPHGWTDWQLVPLGRIRHKPSRVAATLTPLTHTYLYLYTRNETQPAHPPKHRAMNRLSQRFRAGIIATAKGAQLRSALERLRPYATASGSATLRKVHSSTSTLSPNSSNQMPSPCVKAYSMRTTETNTGTDFSCTAEFFNFMKGRFVTNEQHELARRHRKFNVGELAQHAARAVKADRCLSIKKHPDGMYNRVLLLFMDNGKEVVAKIPNPNSGQPHYTTASEVATMKFVSPPSWLHRACSDI